MEPADYWGVRFGEAMGDDLRLPANSQRTWRNDRRDCDNLQ